MRETPERILVVDDEAPVRAVCQRILAPRGYHVETAACARDGLELSRQRGFDLLLTDLRMPGDMDGIALAKELRRQSPGIRVIVMTAFPGVDSAVDSIRLGVLDYLVKPFDASELIRRVSACLDGADPSV